MKRALGALALVALLGAAALVGARTGETRDRFAAEDDVLYLPKPGVLRAISLGHHELAADLVFVRAVIYFGGRVIERAQPRWLENYLDTIVALDPAWKTPYRWAGVATMYDGGEITNTKVLASNHFLELGVERFPDDWELPFMLGCNYLFELHARDADEKARFRRIGAGHVRHAALVGGGPSWLPLLAASMLQKGGDEEAAIRHLEAVYASTTDEDTRREVRNRLVSLHAKVDFTRAERGRADLERGWKATVPYAPPDFYIIMGAPPPARQDVAALAHDPLLD